jgi:hypothetical protein
MCLYVALCLHAWCVCVCVCVCVVGVCGLGVVVTSCDCVCACVHVSCVYVRVMVALSGVIVSLCGHVCLSLCSQTRVLMCGNGCGF